MTRLIRISLGSSTDRASNMRDHMAGNYKCSILILNYVTIKSYNIVAK